jgi:hypothetical protein
MYGLHNQGCSQAIPLISRLYAILCGVNLSVSTAQYSR